MTTMSLIENRSKWHPTITNTVVLEACRRRLLSLGDPGFCLVCGNEQDGCEPDAQNYECEACGAREVFGSDELALVLVPLSQGEEW